MDELPALMRQLLKLLGKVVLIMLTGVVTAEMVSGVLNEVVGLLPVILPASISYIALRKGLGFLTSTLRRA